MTSKIFSVATFIVVSWLAVTIITTSNRVSTLETSLLNGMTASSSALNVRISNMEAEQGKNHQTVLEQLEIVSAAAATPPVDNSAMIAETAKLKQQVTTLSKYAELKKAYKTVLEAEMEKGASPPDAAEKLLSTKSAIWKASTKYAKIKANLQGLMGPIDGLAAKWKSGDTSGTVQPVFEVLKQSLATLDADI